MPALSEEPSRSEESDALLAFEDVSFSYQGQKGPVEAVRSLTFTIKPGETVALIGPSGCGKSTSLLLAAGLSRPSSGMVSVKGQPLREPRKTTAFIPQDLGLFPWRRAAQNITLALKFQGVPKAQAKARAQDALEAVGLSGFENAFPKEMSGGMRQRLALARALAANADLLLLDEPLSAVDALLREALQDTLAQLAKAKGHAQLIVTHSIEEAVYLGQRIFLFSPRPASIIQIIDNPHSSDSAWRSDPDFQRVARMVRSALDGAVQGDNHDA